MKILDYDSVDPLQVLHLTLLALDFPFTPEHAAHIRRTDPRAGTVHVHFPRFGYQINKPALT